MKQVLTQDAPRPSGHYSQAIVHGNLIYLSGQLPIDPQSAERRVGSIEEQTEQVLQNLAAVLKASNSGIAHVIKTTIYISDIALWDRVNEVYAKFFGEHRPARAVVPTRDLHYGFQIEIDAVAAARE